MKHKNVKTGLATHFTIRENNNWWNLLKYPIIHVEIVSEYILRYTESRVWISVEMNKYFLCYNRKPGFQFQNSRPGPGFTTHFTNTRGEGTNPYILDKSLMIIFGFVIYSKCLIIQLDYVLV